MWRFPATAHACQVVNNLLNNAFKFTASGRITLSAEITPDAQGRHMLTCRVSDSGIGMRASLVARIFQPFVQGDAVTTSRYGGTGLGLSICARLCELMGGGISAESVHGVGSAFTISIPVEPATLPVREAVPDTSHRASVMVLCQDAKSGDYLEAWLTAAGWRANVLGSLAAAQESTCALTCRTSSSPRMSMSWARSKHCANCAQSPSSGPP